MGNGENHCQAVSYAKMTWLCQFRAHNPFEDQVPAASSGVVRVDQAL